MAGAGARRQASDTSIGLALGAGGARGFAHIPVLEAFDELGLKPAIIAGTSIGALVGACYAAGVSGRELRDYVNALFRNRTEVFARLWRQKPRQVRDLFVPGALTIGQFDAQRMVEVFMPDWVPSDFASLKIPLTVVATDFYGGYEATLTEGNLSNAVAASVAIPVLFRPVMVNGRVMVDGGIVNPLPFDKVSGATDLVVAVDVISSPARDSTRIPSSTEAIFGAAQLFMRSITSQKLRGDGVPDLLVRPTTHPYKVLDFMKAKSILAAADPVREEVKRSLDKLLAR
jgi:NTE family protein